MKVLTLLTALMFITSFVSAETITLTSGKVIEGEVVERTDELIKVDTGVGVIITYYLDEVANVSDSSMEISSDEKKNNTFPATNFDSSSAGELKVYKNSDWGYELTHPSSYIAVDRNNINEMRDLTPEEYRVVIDAYQKSGMAEGSVFLFSENMMLSLSGEEYVENKNFKEYLDQLLKHPE